MTRRANYLCGSAASYRCRRHIMSKQNKTNKATQNTEDTQQSQSSKNCK